MEYILDSEEELKFSIDDEGFTHLYKNGEYILTLSIGDIMSVITSLEEAVDVAQRKLYMEEINGNG